LLAWIFGILSPSLSRADSTLLANWSFDAGTVNGTSVSDASGNGFTGTLSGGVTSVAGKVGQALQFNGTDGQVSFGNDARAALTGDLSFAAWIKTTNNSRDETIIGKYDASGNERGYVVKTKADGHIAFREGGENTATGHPVEIEDTGATINDGQWHHIAVIVQLSAGVLFFVDGGLSSNFLNDTLLTGSSAPNLAVGGPEFSSVNFTGSIDELRIYQGDLTSAQIAQLYGSTPVSHGGQTLYNGIVLPTNFPPQQTPTQAYRPATYITAPPPIIPIDVGRQLFVDDFLIEQSNLSRTQHRPVMYAGNPILGPDGKDPEVLPFSGGAWFDPADKLFKMWYANGPSYSYMYSTDGINWTRPHQNVIPEGDTMWLDLNETDASKRFKAFGSHPAAGNDTGFMQVWNSPDGVSWSKANTFPEGSDRTSVFYNPFRKVWVLSDRWDTGVPATATRDAYSGRLRYYSESPDLLNWTPSNPIASFWTSPDDQDPPYYPGGEYANLYNLDGVAYESVMVGLFSYFYPGVGYRDYTKPGPILVEINAGFSRDGFQWVRPTRGSGDKAFIPASNIPNTWNAYNTQSVGGCFLVVGDELWFYFTGRTLQKPADGTMSTGLAKLRRDGFYSMDAGGSAGTLTTRPVQFSGKYMFVNVADPSGSLQVEALDASGNVIAPFTKANSVPITVDKTMQAVTWNGVSDLSSLSGRTVKFRFTLTNGSLYSFWVTPDASGASHGYVAAGGPGFTGPLDNVGSGAVINPPPPPNTVATPVITPGGGSFTGGVSVSMQTATSGASIRYTLDGSVPTSNSTLYSAPFNVRANTVVTAQGFATGMNPSQTAMANFTITPDAPPIRTWGSPTGTLPNGTSSTTMGLKTTTPASCKYDASPNATYAAMSGSFSSSDGLTQSATVGGLQSATLYTYYVKCQTSFGSTNTDNYMIRFAVAGPSAPTAFSNYFEAESGQLVAPMTSASDSNASAGQYVASQTAEQGTDSISFSAPSLADYVIWARVLAPDGNTDSVYVSMDGGPEDVYDMAGSLWSPNWQWTVVNGRDNGSPLQLHPRIFTLSAGNHVVTIRGREPGAAIDRIFVTNNLNAVRRPHPFP
jgi:hypothetical protein